MKKQITSLSLIAAVTGLFFNLSVNAQTTLFAPGGTVGNITGTNVGIGTSTPTNYMSGTNGMALYGVLPGLSFPNTAGKTWLFWNYASNYPGGGGDNSFRLWESTGVNTGIDRITVLPGGNVGIGVSTPTSYAKLDVRGGALQVVNYSTNGYGFLARSTDPGNDSYFYHRITTNYHILGTNKNGSGTLRKLGFAVGGSDLETDIKMTIDNIGNVGIGNTNPVNGKLVVSRGGGIPDLEISTNTSADTYGIGIRASGGTNSSALRLMSSVGTVQLYDASNNYSLNIYNAATLGVSLTANGNSYFNGGRVGIGTTNPEAKLQIQSLLGGSTFGKIAFDVLQYSNANIGWNSFYQGFNISRSAATSQWTTGTDGSQNGAVAILSNLGGDIRFVSIPSTTINPGTPATLTDAQVLAATKMKIQSNGSVGIGTTYIPSGYMLAVQGKVITEEVLVKLRANWPDYVFRKEYKLQSLSDLDEYIKSNQHLPVIPSANEIDKSGVSLGEMSTKQMEKIEELTLYVIEMNKKIQEQDKKMQEQSQRIIDLEKASNRK